MLQIPPSKKDRPPKCYMSSEFKIKKVTTKEVAFELPDSFRLHCKSGIEMPVQPKPAERPCFLGVWWVLKPQWKSQRQGLATCQPSGSRNTTLGLDVVRSLIAPRQIVFFWPKGWHPKPGKDMKKCEALKSFQRLGMIFTWWPAWIRSCHLTQMSTVWSHWIFWSAPKDCVTKC